MLSPKRTKFRKMQKGTTAASHGVVRTSRSVTLASNRSTRTLTSRQIEAARMAITRHVKRAQAWIRIFPTIRSPGSRLEVRMGAARALRKSGPPVVEPGRVSTRSPA